MSGPRGQLWIDATQGASGDMLLGALVDLGVPIAAIRDAVGALRIGGWTLEARKIVRCSLAATRVEVRVDSAGPCRNWREIEEIVAGGRLATRVRERALAAFRRLIEAEALAHDQPFDEVHLHEAGGIDAIVDVVGTCAGVEQLAVDEIVVSPMTTGFGQIRCEHGVYPVPAPATLLLVRGAPVRGGEVEAERLTPTGAALLMTLADRWGPLPPMRPRAVGHGAGARDLGDVPNLLRLIVGQAEPTAPGIPEREGQVAVLECTLDDATPQAVAFASRRLLEAGALEAFTSPVTMKKGRAGQQLTVVARPADAERLAREILRQTSTLGVRARLDRRYELDREFVSVDTEFGAVRVKAGSLDGLVLHAWPEYDDCASLAERHDVPLARVQQAALAAYEARRKRQAAADGSRCGNRETE